MKFNSFSLKQKIALTWWANPHTSHFDAIICDGAVRSGKTLCLSLGFISWAMASFSNGSFALCGKTVTSLRRNVISPLIPLLSKLGFECNEKISASFLDVSALGHSNRFYYFGGKDESSASLIQGVTLFGLLLDEVALMPRSFVEQAIARCSVTGSKLWFSCNPEHPYHWFFKEWICKQTLKNTLYLHFTMKDNPSLTPNIRNRYNTLYNGVFYDRFVLGKWTAASGLVYTMFNKNIHVIPACQIPNCSRFIISCDYGTVNPSSFGLWGFADSKWYRINEYYYASKLTKILKTDEEYYSDLASLAFGYNIDFIIVDPSAASFIECIRRHHTFSVRPAKNDVLSGIRRVCDALKQQLILFSDVCSDSIREFNLYVWDEKAPVDAPIKENDHAMDEIRYFVNMILSPEKDNFFVTSIARK